MSLLALEYNAINLGQGFPDYPMNETLISLVHKAMLDGHNQYANTNGVMTLRECLHEKINFLYNILVNPEKEITITPGGTYAIYTALTSVLNAGDEVIVFEPCFDSYIPNIEINGATAIVIPLKHPDYKIDWNIVRQSITPATRMIMINSPNNPTGNILDKEDMMQLESVVEGTNILILSDEVYEHIIFDNKEHESILKYPSLFQRSFIAFSFGKVYNCTGWKIGYCVAPHHLMNEFRKVHQFNCFTCNAPVQFALATFLNEKEEYLNLGKFLQQKRDYFLALMKQTPFLPIPSKGSYFQLYDYSSITNERENDFAIRITKEAGVATIPLSSFYKSGIDNKVLRFCFAKKETTLKEAVDRLKNYFY